MALDLLLVNQLATFCMFTYFVYDRRNAVTHMWRTEEAGSLHPSCGPWRSDSVAQAWWQTPFPSVSSPQDQCSATCKQRERPRESSVPEFCPSGRGHHSSRAYGLLRFLCFHQPLAWMFSEVCRLVLLCQECCCDGGTHLPAEHPLYRPSIKLVISGLECEQAGHAAAGPETWKGPEPPLLHPGKYSWSVTVAAVPDHLPTHLPIYLYYGTPCLFFFIINLMAKCSTT